MNIPLQDLCEIRSGFHFRGRVESDPEGNVALIQIKDLDDEFALQDAELIRVQVEKPESYLVRQGDVLFVARGTRLGATALTQPLDDTIATGSFFILRPRSVLLPEFLAWSMNSPAFQTQLRRTGQGTDLVLVRRADLKELTLEVPSLDVQRMIVALDEGARRERQLCAQISAKRAALVEAIAARAIQNSGARQSTGKGKI